ncbi:MAG: HNH endonuclease, partial [Actinomycetota bacterium]|nr:HNH endonuclease [Actinomycetota bacterium]
VGCGAPANRCHIHHIRWWRHHGATDLHNLTLLCWTCHHNVHHNNWTITTNPDGGYTAQPPDPPTRPIHDIHHDPAHPSPPRLGTPACPPTECRSNP